ncbi:MAG: transcriptional repressor [Saprospiraceae bacterium]|nr:transcriptional repressor [Saprospiraceae bacterium]
MIIPLKVTSFLFSLLHSLTRLEERSYLCRVSRAQEILKSVGLSKTETRIGLVNLFLQSTSALSLQAIESSLEKLDRITLYRNLRTFESKGLIHKAVDGTTHPKYALCDAHCAEHNHQDNHPHFHCRKCQKTVCLEEVQTPSLSALPKGYSLEDTNLILSGTCPDCS